MDFQLHLEGTKIGDYLFGRRLGDGMYGEVYFAYELDNSKKIRKVAIKVAFASPLDSDRYREQDRKFTRELGPAASVQDTPGFVTFYTKERVEAVVGADGTVVTLSELDSLADRDEAIPVTFFMLVLEFVDGGDLNHDYRRTHVINSIDGDYLTHLIDVTHALKKIHLKGYSHCDIKPGNLLYDKQANTVKIADLGIARTPDHVADGTVSGSPPFMSPEAFVGDESAARDRYALALTVFWLLTGRRALNPGYRGVDATTDHRTPLEVWAEVHSTAERPHAAAISPKLVSVHLSDVLYRMMAADPDQRPEDLDELINALILERDRRFRPEKSVLASEEPPDLPEDRVAFSDYSINPRFRSSVLGERLHYIFINVAQPTRRRMRELLLLARKSFGDTFALCDTYGAHDIVVRVWSEPQSREIEEFCENVIRQVLFDDTNAVRVFPVADVEYPEGIPRLPENLDYQYAKIHLNHVQQSTNGVNGPQKDKSRKWLRSKKVFSRKRLQPSRAGVKAFTLLAPGRGVSEPEATAMFALLLRRLHALNGSRSIRAISVFRRESQIAMADDRSRRIEMSDYPFLIKFIASQFREAIEVPDCLTGEISGTGIRSSTMLSTGRLFIDSDRIRPQ